MRFHIPRPVAIAADFGVNDIESRLAGKIFEVLQGPVSPVAYSQIHSLTTKKVNK